MHHLTRTLPFALGLAVSALLTEPAAAQTSAGSYALAEIGGKTLPGVIEVEGDCREEIVNATLTLNADGTWQLERHERDVCGDKTEDEKESDKGRYRVTGTSIEFMDDDGDVQTKKEGDDLEDLSTGTLQANTISVKLGATENVAVFRKK